MDERGVTRCGSPPPRPPETPPTPTTSSTPPRPSSARDPSCSSGEEEGRLSFAGATADLDPATGPFLVVDIGGGSTECMVGTDRVEARAVRSTSAACGSPRSTSTATRRRPRSCPTPSPRPRTGSTTSPARCPGAARRPHGRRAGGHDLDRGRGRDRPGRVGPRRHSTTSASRGPPIEDVFRTLATEPLADRVHNPGLEAGPRRRDRRRLLRARRPRAPAGHRGAAGVGERHPRRPRRQPGALRFRPCRPPSPLPGTRRRTRGTATRVGRFGHGARRPRSSTSSGSGRSPSPAWFWDAVVDHLGIPFTDAVRAGARRPRPASPGPRWFTGGPHQPGRRLLRPLGRPRRPTPTPSCGRARRATTRTWTYAELRAQADGLAAAARRPRRAGGRRGRHLPPDAPRDDRRRPGRRQARRRRSCRCSRATAPRPSASASRTPARGRARSPPTPSRAAVDRSPMLETALEAATVPTVDDHRGRRPPGRRPLRRTTASSPGRRRLPPSSPRRPSTASTPCSSPTRRARPGRPKGVGARPRRLDGEGRRGGRLPDRHRPGRPRLLAHRPRLDHGPVAAHRRPGQRRHRPPLRRRPRPPRTRPPVGVPRRPPGHALRRQPHARAGPHGPRRRRRPSPTTCPRCGSSPPPASRGTRTRGTGTSSVVGGGRCPVINISGGTEVGACFLSPHPVEPISPMSLGGPSLGMAVDVFDDDGRPLRGAVGRARVHPAVARHDPRACATTPSATSTPTGRAGPTCGCTATGRRSRSRRSAEWFLHGRSDDTIKVAGKRLGPAEVETRAGVAPRRSWRRPPSGCPTSSRASSCGPTWSLGPGVEPTDALRAELVGAGGRRSSGKSFRPAGVRFVARAARRPAAPRSCAASSGPSPRATDPGDLSSLEDVSSLDAIREAS